MLLSFILSIALCCPWGSIVLLALPRETALCPEMTCPAHHLPLWGRFPGVGNQSCSVLFLPRRQCSLVPECSYLGKEREVTFTEHRLRS